MLVQDLETSCSRSSRLVLPSTFVCIVNMSTAGVAHRARQPADWCCAWQMVLVQDPEVPSIMQQMGQAPPAGDNRGREKRFIFDHAFDGSSSNSVVYRGTVQVRFRGAH